MAEPLVKVLDFEGPLDLLIHLIEKDKIDIYDIPIVSITDQYMAFLDSMAELDLEVASDFLVMAARLLQIKSRMLLPKLPSNDEEDEEDPRQALIEMVVELQRFKKIARELAERQRDAAQYHTRRPMYGSSKLRRLHRYSVESLLEAMSSLTSPLIEELAVVERQEFDIREKMEDMVSYLHKHPQGVELSEAFVRTGLKSERIASFLAVLELLRLKIIRISQSHAFDPIYIFLREGGDSHGATTEGV
ncbi:MAG: Segregation and condensation protein A [Succiniclasticum sp.]|jgi:segregation and condensation protein A